MAVLEEPTKEAIVLKNYSGDEWAASKGSIHEILNPATQKVIAKAPS